MIQAHFKFKASLLAALLISLAFPSAVFAQAVTARGTAEKTFCDRIDEAADAFSVRLGGGEARLLAQREESRLKVIERHLTRETRRTEHRNEWDLRRDEFYLWLSEYAQTEKQKTAVAVFKEKIDAAVTLRRSAVDVAVAAFRAGIDMAISERKKAVDAALENFKKETELAIGHARSACERGVEEKVNRDIFAEEMRGAQARFVAEIKNIEIKKETLKGLTNTRKADIDNAVSDFSAVLEKAKTELESAF